MCPEPGGVSFSTRTHYTGPYNPGSQVTYNCFDGGSGTIACERSGSWTQKPVCSGQSVAFHFDVTLLPRPPAQMARDGCFLIPDKQTLGELGTLQNAVSVTKINFDSIESR